MSFECPPTPPYVSGGTIFERTPSPKERKIEDITNCPICLDKLTDKAILPSCFHQFCFKCILRWSKVKVQCPLCKGVFETIIHSIKSDNVYNEFHVSSILDHNDDGIFTMLSDIELPSESAVEHTMSWMEIYLGSRGRQSEQPFMNMSSIPTHHAFNRSSTRHQSLTFRVNVYKNNLFVNAESVTDRLTGRSRATSAQWYTENTAQTHRLVPWLTRELKALQMAQSMHVPNIKPKSICKVVDEIMSAIRLYDINSSQFFDFIVSYTGPFSSQFQHEFFHFARSPYDMIGYDNNVSYSSTPPLLLVESEDDEIEPVASTSSSRTNHVATKTDHIICISDDESDDDTNDVEIIATLKPKHERTPTLVILDSDSDIDSRQVLSSSSWSSPDVASEGKPSFSSSWSPSSSSPSPPPVKNIPPYKEIKHKGYGKRSYVSSDILPGDNSPSRLPSINLSQSDGYNLLYSEEKNIAKNRRRKKRRLTNSESDKCNDIKKKQNRNKRNNASCKPGSTSLSLVIKMNNVSSIAFGPTSSILKCNDGVEESLETS